MEKAELKIFIGMSRVLNKINRATNKVYTKHGLTSGQFAVLEALYHKGDLSVGDVQEKILSTSGTIPVIVKNLEKEGFLERRNDEIDNRRFILHITQNAKKELSERNIFFSFTTNLSLLTADMAEYVKDNLERINKKLAFGHFNNY